MGVPGRSRRGMRRQRVFLSDDARVEVVGESQYQEALWGLVGQPASDDERPVFEGLAYLQPEPENPHDSSAVQVLIEDRLVGYLDRETAASLQPALLRLLQEERTPVAVPFKLTGGFARDDGERASLGVLLKFNPKHVVRVAEATRR